MAHRAAQLHLGGGAAEVEVPLGEQGGYLGRIDAARCGPRRPGANANISSTALVTDRGWSLDEYEAWIGDTLYHQLMSPEAVDPAVL